MGGNPFLERALPSLNRRRFRVCIGRRGGVVPVRLVPVVFNSRDDPLAADE